jgi:hypothetical protein
MAPAPFHATKHLTEGFQRNPICLDFGRDRVEQPSTPEQAALGKRIFHGEVGHKSVLVEGDRGQAHRIERGGWRSARSARCCEGGALDQAPGKGRIAGFRIHVNNAF